MRVEGVLRGPQVTTFLTEIQNGDASETVELDLRAVDRVEYAALIEMLVIASHLASARRRLRVDAPSDVVLGNELARIQAGRMADPASTEALIGRSAIARSQRRQALHRELVINGFFRALQQAYSLHAADGLLEITGIAPRLLARRVPQDDVSRRTRDGERIRRIAFQWLVLGAGPTSTTGSNPLMLANLGRVLSQDQEIASVFDAAAIERYVVGELLQNVDEHAYPAPFTGVRAILVGAVAMWATEEVGIDATFGPDGRSVYMYDGAPDDVGALATLAVSDNGVGIPRTLRIVGSDRDRLRSWAPDLRSRAGLGEQSVAWAFHPLSTGREDLPQGKRRFRGLSYVMGQARRYRGAIHARSSTATVDWSFLEGSRTLATSARASFPGTSIAVTLTAPQSTVALAPQRLPLGNREVSVTPIVSGNDPGLIERLIEAEAVGNEEAVLAFAVEPAPPGTSLDRHLLRAVEGVTSAAGGWSRDRPWFCLVPCSAADADALLNADEEHTLSARDRAEAGVSRLDAAVLVLGVDGVFAWVGGSTQERSSLASATSLGRGFHTVSLAESVMPLTPWLRGRGAAARPIAGEVDLLDGVASAVSEWLRSMVEAGAKGNVVGVEPGGHLLRSLQLTDPLVDLARLVEHHGVVTATACALGWGWRARMPADTRWRYMHTDSVPRSVAALLNSRPLAPIPSIGLPPPDEVPVVVLDGVSATTNSLRSALSWLIKDGVRPARVAGVLDMSGTGRSEVRAVFRSVPCAFLVSLELAHDPGPVVAAPRPPAVGFDLHELLTARPQAIQIGHFSRRRGRHMDVFVDVAHLFSGPEPGPPGVTDSLRSLAEEIRERLSEWRSTVTHEAKAIDVLYPADDEARAGAFARWLQPLCAEGFGVVAGLSPVPRELSHSEGEPFDDVRVAVLADWGAVTAASLHAMVVNLARRGYQHAMTLLLTSQMGADQELIESSIRLIDTPAEHGRACMTTRIEVLSRLDLGYSQESACPLCRARSNVLDLAIEPGVGEPLGLRAAHRADELAVQPVPAPTRVVEVDPSQTAGPTLVDLRARLRNADDDQWDKLELFRELDARSRSGPIDPAEPMVLAWARLVVMEPQWMSGSTIDLDDFRAVLVRLFVGAIETTTDMPQGPREEMQRHYLVALRVVSKSEFLRVLPRIAHLVESEEVILDGLLHVATMLDRPYHQSPEALRLMAEALEGVGATLRPVAAESFESDRLSAARSAHYLLEQRVAVATRRAEIGDDPQRGWDLLKTVYVGRQVRHEGLESEFDPLRLEIASSRIRKSLASDDAAVRRRTVHKLLREPWQLCAERLTEDVLPSLGAIGEQLEVVVPLVATAPEVANGRVTKPGLDVWRRRLLAPRPAIFEEVDSILRRLESGNRVERSLSELQDVLAWAYDNVFRPQPNGGATLFECAKSIPTDAPSAAELVNELARSMVGVEAEVETMLELRIFVAGPVLEGVLRRLLENVVTHQPKEREAPARVHARIDSVGSLARLRLSNSGTDPSIQSSVSGRHGLTAARRLLEPFGGRLEIVDPSDADGLTEATFVVDVMLPVWATDAVEGM